MTKTEKKKLEAAKKLVFREMGRRRWAGTTKEERRAHALWVNQQRPGYEGQKPHCPCGKMTLERAKKRNHKCTAT